MKTLKKSKFNITKKSIDSATVVASNFEQEHSRKRVFASVAILGALSSYFGKQEIEIDAADNLYKVAKFNEQFEIADFYCENRRIDLRICFEGEFVSIPKIHFEQDLTPALYLAVQTDSELNKAELIGFINPAALQLDKVNSNQDYYFVSKSDLSPIEDFYGELQACPKQIPFNDRLEEPVEALMCRYFDDEIDGKESNLLAKILLSNKSLADKFVEFYSFEYVARKMADYPEIPLETFEADFQNTSSASAVELPLITDDEDIQDIQEDKIPVNVALVEEKEKDESVELVMDEAFTDDTSAFDEPVLDLVEVGNLEELSQDEPLRFEEGLLETAKFKIEDEEPLKSEDDVLEIADESFEAGDDELEFFDESVYEPVVVVQNFDEDDDFVLDLDNEEEKVEKVEKIEIETVDLPSSTALSITNTVSAKDYSSFESRNGDLSNDVISKVLLNDTQKDEKSLQILFEKEEIDEIDSGSQIELPENSIDFIKILKNKKVVITACALACLLVAGVGYGIFSGIKSSQADLGKNSLNQTEKMFDEDVLKSDNFDIAEQPSKDPNRAITDIFSDGSSTVSITKISWEASANLANNADFRQYLQVAGQNLQLNLQNDLLEATEYAYSEEVKINLKLAKDNTIKELGIVESSGSEQIDTILLQSVKNTVKYLKVPSIQDSATVYNLTLVIDF